MATDLKLTDCIDEVQKEAHKEYLKTWSIITEGAENNGEYSNELLYQVIENQQKIASDLSLLATLTERLAKAVEAHTGETINF